MSENKKIKTSIMFDSDVLEPFQALAHENRRTTTAQLHHEMEKAIAEDKAKKSLVAFVPAAAAPLGTKARGKKKSSG